MKPINLFMPRRKPSRLLTSRRTQRAKLVEIKKSRFDRVYPYALALISVLSVLLNFLIVYITVLPRYSLEIIDPDLCFDAGAASNRSYLDSTYVRFNLYNSGNKPISFFSIKVELVDSHDTTLAVVARRFKVPSILQPGEISDCIIRVYIVRVWNRRATRPMMYTVPCSGSYEELLSISHQTGIPQMLFPLTHPITLTVDIRYTGDKSSKLERTISYFVPIDIPKH